MMEGFDEKRGVIKKLLDMLKEHASNEVGNGLQHPEGEGDMHGIQAERVEVLPEHGMDEPTPEHDVVTHEMSDGGMVEGNQLREPNNQDGTYHEDTSSDTYKSDGQKQAEATMADGGYVDTDSEPSSMFASFLGRKKKK